MLTQTPGKRDFCAQGWDRIGLRGVRRRLKRWWCGIERLRQLSDSIIPWRRNPETIAASLVTGSNEPVPGWDLHPLKSSAFHGALFRQLSTADDAANALS